tara:strand:+ start:324 stop:452 length:129 start_codon:yes stop_codon:yes gene_type:complete
VLQQVEVLDEDAARVRSARLEHVAAGDDDAEGGGGGVGRDAQ